MILLISILCAIGALGLGLCSAVILRRRARWDREQPPAPTIGRVPLRGLPGLPPERGAAAPPSWAAVEHELEPRPARGSVPPPRKLAPNRFDDVLTTGLPTVKPQQQRAFVDEESVDDGWDDPSAGR